jgi:hypothetical protein
MASEGVPEEDEVRKPGSAFLEALVAFYLRHAAQLPRHWESQPSPHRKLVMLALLF